MTTSKKNREPRARTVVRKALRGLALPSPCLVAIKHGTDLANKPMIDELVKTMNRVGVAGMVVVLSDFDDLTVLDEEAMAPLGWVLNKDKSYDGFSEWLEENHPDVELVDWQDDFARAYLNSDAEMLLASREAASGRTFISSLLKEFKES